MDKGTGIRLALKFIYQLVYYGIAILIARSMAPEISSNILLFVYYMGIISVFALILGFMEAYLSNNRKFMVFYLRINPYDVKVRNRLAAEYFDESDKLLDEVEESVEETKHIFSEIDENTSKIEKLEQLDDPPQIKINQLVEKNHLMRQKSEILVDQQESNLERAKMLNKMANKLLNNDLKTNLED